LTVLYTLHLEETKGGEACCIITSCRGRNCLQSFRDFRTEDGSRHGQNLACLFHGETRGGAPGAACCIVPFCRTMQGHYAEELNVLFRPAFSDDFQEMIERSRAKQVTDSPKIADSGSGNFLRGCPTTLTLPANRKHIAGQPHDMLVVFRIKKFSLPSSRVPGCRFRVQVFIFLVHHTGPHIPELGFIVED